MLFAFVFESVGAGEWLVLLAVLLVVIGPKNLPSTLRKMGNYYAKFRRTADAFKRQLMDMDYELERQVREAEMAAEAAVKDVKDEVKEAAEEVQQAAEAPTERDTSPDNYGSEPIEES